MDDYLTDEQQAEQVRTWIRQNGPFILGAVALGVAVIFGWNQYQVSVENRAKDASLVYEDLRQSLRDGRDGDALRLLDELDASYKSTPYPDQSRLAIAKSQIDRNDFDSAAATLRRVADRGFNEQLRHVARLRLARIELHEGRHDAALEALNAIDPNSAFAARAHEVRGDVYLAIGRTGDARNEYESALASGEPGVVDRQFVQAKLDALGPGTGPAAATEPDTMPKPGSPETAPAG